MLRVDDDDDGRIFAPLRLVDGRRVGKDELVEVSAVVFDRTPVEVHNHRAVVGVDGLHESDVAVVDILVVVVTELHHAVADAEHRPAANNRIPTRIQRLLEFHVEIVRPQDVLPHRHQNLHVLQGIHPELARNARRHELDRPFDAHLRILAAHEVEVRLALPDFERLARVHMMRVRDDESRRVLTEDEVEFRRGNRAGLDEVPENASRADGRQLVRIAHPHDRSGIGNCRKKIARELHVDHRRLVEDEDIALKTVLRVEGELVGDGIPLEKPMNRKRVVAGVRARPPRNGRILGRGCPHPRRAKNTFRHSLGRASRRRRQNDAQFLLSVDFDECTDNRGLADAWSARDDGELRLERVLERLKLLRRELKARP